MTTYTDAKDALLIATAKEVREILGRAGFNRHAVALQQLISDARRPNTQSPAEPNPNREEIKGELGAEFPRAEPKPGAGVSDEAKRAAWDAFVRIANSPFPPALEAALEAAAPYICAAKDADTRAVIADNDAKMAEVELLKAELAKFQDDYGERCLQITQQATEIERLKVEKDDAYRQRNYLVAALARLFPSGIRKTNIPGWDEDWHGCVYIDLPSGQISYHYHDSQAHLFKALPHYLKPWDYHDKEDVHDRLVRLDALRQSDLNMRPLSMHLLEKFVALAKAHGWKSD